MSIRRNVSQLNRRRHMSVCTCAGSGVDGGGGSSVCARFKQCISWHNYR